MWGRGYFACATGNVSDEMVREYLDNHTENEDSFRVQDDFESKQIRLVSDGL